MKLLPVSQANRYVGFQTMIFVFVYVFRYYCINLHSRSEFHIFMRFDIKNDKEIRFQMLDFGDP